MDIVAVVGAAGRIGRIVLEQLAADGVTVQRVGRELSHRTDEAIGDAAVVVDATGGQVPQLLAAAGARGCHVVEVRPDQASVQGRFAAPAPSGDATLVPGAGLQPLVGDLLAHVAGSAVGELEAVHVAYVFPDHRGVLGGASPARRRIVAEELAAPMLALLDGDVVDEPLGEHRRLAWFPRPIGPHHAAAIPGAEMVTVPRHLPGVATVRTYVAISGWRAELLQFVGNASTSPAGRRRLVERLERPVSEETVQRRADRRWACVAEAAGSDGVARAWAYGRGPERLTGRAAAVVARRLLGGGTPTGVRSPAELGAPPRLLDELAMRTDLRWSLSRPDEPVNG